MQMADLARQIADRDGMEPKEAYEETMRLQYILLGFESTLGDENVSHSSSRSMFCALFPKTC